MAAQGAVRRLSRDDRRAQILVAAATSFARTGYAATSLDDIAAAAGVTRVVVYRHFDTKADLYRSVVDQMCDRLDEQVPDPAAGLTDGVVDGLLTVAAYSSAGFRLLFQHVRREPEFGGRIERFTSDLADAVGRQVAPVVPDPDLARWAARTALAAVTEAVIAWLDAGQPDAEHAAIRIRRVADGVVEAAR